MAELVLFHHALGQTSGFHAFAADLRLAGHRIHTPDLYEGRTFDTVDAGVAHVRRIGFGKLMDRGVAAAAALPQALVYAGFSMGAMPAQKLAQTRSGALGALLFHACMPVAEFSPSWPKGVGVQIHAMEADPFFVGEDLTAARHLAASAAHAELYLYPGDKHLFADRSLPDHDVASAALLMKRVLAFLSAR